MEMEMPDIRLSPKPDVGSQRLLTRGEQDSADYREKVVVIGSGEMATALCVAMVRAGMKPVVGSRYPDSARARLKCADVTVLTVPEALTEGDLVLLAIHDQFYDSLPRQLLEGKIVVDMSNRSADSKPSDTSSAERLQENFPECHVVKAFNTISAFALQHGNVRGSKEIPLCSDSARARQRVSSLARDIGFTPQDFGALRTAREVGEIPFRLFPGWKGPGVVTLAVFLLFYLFLFFRRQICPNIESPEPWDWNRFQSLPLKNGMLAFALTGAVLLLACYVPGTIAGYIQLCRGTKYTAFPRWLDSWLKSRKQLGLLALLTGSMHGCTAVFTQMGEGMDVPSDWSQQLFITLGVVLLAALVILGLASLPSVAGSLTWREFTFLQRYLGWVAVLLLTGHAFFKGWRKLFENRFACVVLPHENQVIMLLCFLVILLKLPLLIPCIHSYLMKLRRGHVRKSRGIP